jgi:uncharacterized protein YutE (UPF0331/DUF86 family)
MLSNLRQYLAVLRRLAGVPKEPFLADVDNVGNAKYHFVIAIEGYRFPKDNADSFVVLIEHGVLDSGLRERLRAMAGFRNRPVHLYWEVDDERVHQYLQDSLDDIDRFASDVARRAAAGPRNGDSS